MKTTWLVAVTTTNAKSLRLYNNIQWKPMQTFMKSLINLDEVVDRTIETHDCNTWQPCMSNTRLWQLYIKTQENQCCCVKHNIYKSWKQTMQCALFFVSPNQIIIKKMIYSMMVCQDFDNNTTLFYMWKQHEIKCFTLTKHRKLMFYCIAMNLKTWNSLKASHNLKEIIVKNNGKPQL